MGHRTIQPPPRPVTPTTRGGVQRAIARHHQYLAALHERLADLDDEAAAPTPVTVWISTSEAARQWGVHRETVRLWADAGRIHAKWLGNTWRVDRDAPLMPRGHYTRQAAG